MKTILVIDDDRHSLNRIRRTFEEAGFRVLCSARGRLGLLYHRLFGVDVILLDMFMPEMDGLEVLLTLTEEGSTTPVAVMVEKDGRMSSQWALDVALEMGAVAGLRKPVHPRDLHALVQDMLLEAA